MAGSKILVFGGTGPLGICLLRELLHRGHATIAYARSPSKIPEDLAGNPLLEVKEEKKKKSCILEIGCTGHADQTCNNNTFRW